MNVRLLLVFWWLVMLSSCGYFTEYEVMHKQLPTFANMQAICLRIEDKIERFGAIDCEQIEEILEMYNNGNDSWNNPYIYKTSKKISHDDGWYILVSTGKDGILDVDNIENYLHEKEEYIVGDFDRDIVFINGKPLRIASPK